MLTVHHLRLSQSDRIIWLCEELGLDYTLKSYARDTDRSAPAELQALSPFGTAPVIVDDGRVLGESAAIVEYLCMRHGDGRLTLRPDHADYADYLFWFHFGNGSLMPALMIDHLAAATLQTGAAESVAGPPSRTRRVIDLAERRLAEAPYFAGAEFTAADIMMCLPLFGDRMNLTNAPNIVAYLERVTARPAWQQTLRVR